MGSQGHSINRCHFLPAFYEVCAVLDALTQPCEVAFTVPIYRWVRGRVSYAGY